MAAGDQFEKLVAVMRTLRSHEGCPWDREQTLESLTPFVLEEAYEVIEAIERGDMPALREEIGDHIFEGVFLAQIASGDGLFTVGDSLPRSWRNCTGVTHMSSRKTAESTTPRRNIARRPRRQPSSDGTP